MTTQTNHGVAVMARQLAADYAVWLGSHRAAGLAELSDGINRSILAYQNKCVAYVERLRKEGDSIAFLLSLLDDEQMMAWTAHIGGEPQ
tara:strand:- start:3142 stop:3408 length:267 start_codon:yes stop_codon:yes gene_type:complete